ncbi:MAG: hypothetical protein HYV07_03690 [Deltaproteobacteria bacterium]|nr:hypothetical protein [Deltaproteobacteria bacterium]
MHELIEALIGKVVPSMRGGRSRRTSTRTPVFRANGLIAIASLDGEVAARVSCELQAEADGAEVSDLLGADPVRRHRTSDALLRPPPGARVMRRTPGTNPG